MRLFIALFIFLVLLPAFFGSDSNSLSYSGYERDDLYPPL